ncbi:hypothetical protein AALP_AAs46524U000600 [Arabis alpina]|uniref:Uncharacterized protein n=1 Tax=Arabis alpina TaxID=50452 RepID=A0A087FXY4_ARAAL|nr:hypothetical protein AALP_AAs46524U000600 [Arabis alpina]
MFNQEIIVHWKLRGVNGEHKVEVDMDSSKMDHLVVFHFNIITGLI